MAIFIASTKSISRGKGQSAVASASYRAGVELEDKRYGKTHDYSKKHGVMSADIILPSALAATNVDIDRSDLWNKAESAEKRKDARVAREWLINLPHELSEQDRKALAHQFAQTLADRYGTIADCAIHQPTQKEIDRGADPRNFHAHILFTTRAAELDADNKIILTDKATIELSDNKRRSLGMARVSHEIKEVRQIWEQIANEKLAEYNHQLIDSRSYTDQGIDIVPQLKMGSVATKLERDKFEQDKKEHLKDVSVIIDDTPATIRGEINRMIAERNNLVWTREIADNKKTNDKADQIIADLRKSKLFAVPTVPKPEFKSRKVTQARIDSANDAVNRLKEIRLNREKVQQAEQERLKQQQIADAAQKKLEQAEQEELERQQRKEQIRKNISTETQQFTQHYKRLEQQPIHVDKSHLQQIDTNSEFGQQLMAIVATDTLMKGLTRYRNDPSITKHQKELAERQYEHLGNDLISHSQSALDSSKSTRHTVSQKESTAALKGVFDAMVHHHKQNLSQEQQERLQSVSAAINDHSYDINRSRGMGLGF